MLPGIGIFGCGQLVRLLVACVRAKGFKVTAIWSYTMESAAQVAKELDIAFATDVIDRVLLLPSVQLIVIACPPHFHEQIATKACGIGKHVLCDWPPAVSLAQMAAMNRAAMNYPSLITILFNSLRFLPAFLKMKKLISDGVIGQINVINCTVFGDSLQGTDTYSISCDELMGGGLLANIGTHVIDIVTFVTGLRAKRVHGIVRNYCQNKDKVLDIRKITADDFVSFQMEMENNLSVANVTLNGHVFGQFTHEVLVCGTKGYLAVRGGDLYTRHVTAPAEEVLFVDSEDLSDNNNLPMMTSSAKSVLPKPYGKGLIRMISALKEAFQCSPSGDEPQTNGESNGASTDYDEKVFHWAKEAVSLAANFEDGQYIQAVIEAIKFSSKNKEWVRINYETHH